MKLRFFLCFVLIVEIVGCRQSGLKVLQAEIDTISAKYVPDKRTGICKAEIMEGAGHTVILKGETLFGDAKNEIAKLIERKGYKLVDSLIVLPDTALKANNFGLVTVSVANLRTKPSHAAELSSQAIMGAPLRILKKKGGWLMVQTPDQYISWTNTSSVERIDSTRFAQWKATDRLIFIEMTGNIFVDTDESAVVSDLVIGSIVEKRSEMADYFKVALPDKREGFVKKKNLADFNNWKNSAELLPAELCRTAQKFSGLPYMWGGTSSKALDCSGFMKNIFFMHGLILERDASQQINHGLKIDTSEGYKNLEPGDLLFFGSRNPYRVVHVGMYLGNNEVIHASGIVDVSSMDKSKPNFSAYLSDTYLETRRIVGTPAEPGLWLVKMHGWY